jgi:hypothetical protein
MGIHNFINVDLEIRGEENLGPLLSAFGEAVFVLHSELNGNSQLAVLELSEEQKNPDDTIHRFCDLIERLAPDIRLKWDRLAVTEFDIGYDASRDNRCTRFALRKDTVKRMAAVSASLAGERLWAGTAGMNEWDFRLLHDGECRLCNAGGVVWFRMRADVRPTGERADSTGLFQEPGPGAF